MVLRERVGVKRFWGESLAHAKGGWTRWIDVEKIKYGFARRVRSKKRKSRISLLFKMYDLGRKYRSTCCVTFEPFLMNLIKKIEKSKR